MRNNIFNSIISRRRRRGRKGGGGKEREREREREREYETDHASDTCYQNDEDFENDN